jgi:hypothetical protein
VRTVLAALVAGCVVAVAGCSAAGTAVPAAAAATVANARDGTLAAGLLTAADLPLGLQPPAGAGAAAALGCAGIDGAYLPAGSSAHATASFAHSLSPAFVNETVTLRPAGAAAAALDRFRAAATDCSRFSGPDGTRYAVTPVSLPRYGDGSAASWSRSPRPGPATATARSPARCWTGRWPSCPGPGSPPAPETRPAGNEEGPRALRVCVQNSAPAGLAGGSGARWLSGIRRRPQLRRTGGEPHSVLN